MKRFEKLKQFWPVLLLPLILFGGLLLLDQGDDSSLKERGLQVQEIDDPEGPTKEIVTVSPEAIPTTMRDRLEAPSMALLPHRTGYPEMNGEQALPPGQAEEVKVFAEDFLRSWETYDPGDPSYEKKLQPFADPETLPALVDRVDSADQSGVCPQAGCPRGSRWYESEGFAGSAFILDWQDPYLYLIAYGALRYDRAGDLDGSTERSYGLLLRKKGAGWVVERAAAESLR